MISSKSNFVLPWRRAATKSVRNAFISPTAYASPDIACHLGATPAGAEAPVNAGDTLEIQWTPWPATHKGPVIDYLAKCDGSCVSPLRTVCNVKSEAG